MPGGTAPGRVGGEGPGRSEEQLLLRPVVAVERALGHPGQPAEVVHVHVVISAAGERVLGGVEEPSRREPPPGVSGPEAVAEIRDVLDSIGDTCPECPAE